MELRSITVETLAAFAQALRAEERCTETIKQYTRSVRQFAAWLAPETVRGGPFASREPNLLRKVGEDRFLPDDFSHEQSMVLETGRGLVGKVVGQEPVLPHLAQQIEIGRAHV